jgi:hypothetical protein
VEGDPMRTARVIAVGLLLMAFTAYPSGQPAPFSVPQPDVRLAINATLFRRLVQLANGFSWGGVYHNNGIICTSPDVHLELQNPDLLVRSWNSWVDGNGALHLRLAGSPKIFTNDNGCLSLGLVGQCSIDGCTTSLLPGFGQLNARCTLFGATVVNDELVFPNPLALAGSVPIDLPSKPIPSGSGEIQLEFGHFVGDRWFRDPAPHRRDVMLLSTARGLQGLPLKSQTCSDGQDPSTCDDPVCGVPKDAAHTLSRRESGAIVLDVSLWPQRFSAAVDAAAATAALDANNPLRSNDLVGVSISRRLLIGDTDGGGFFQKILPIRVSGYQVISGTRVEFELFLTQVRAAYGRLGQSDAVELSFDVSRARFWDSATPSLAVAIDEVHAEAISTLPVFGVDTQQPGQATLSFALKQFRLGVKGKLGALSVCFTSDELAAQLEHMIGAIARYQGPGPLLPACINAGNDRMTASQACPDGIQQGRMSAEHPEKNLRITLDIGAASSRLDASGNWAVSVPLVQQLLPRGASGRTRR